MLWFLREPTEVAEGVQPDRAHRAKRSTQGGDRAVGAGTPKYYLYKYLLISDLRSVLNSSDRRKA